MGWRDAPVIGEKPAASTTAASPPVAVPAPAPATGWRSAPVIGAPAPTQTAASVAPAAPASTTPLINLNPFSGQPDKVGEFVKTALDTGTMGVGDLLQGAWNKTGLPGGTTGAGGQPQTTEQLRAQTQAGRQDIGPIAATAADIAGYAALPGAGVSALKGATGVGRGLIGAAAEGAGYGAGSAAGHGETDLTRIAQSAGTGGILGVGGQAVGNVVGAGVRGIASRLPGALSPEGVTNALDAAQQAKYGELAPIKYDPNAAKAGVDSISARLYAGDDGTFRAATPQTNRFLNQYSANMAKASTGGVDTSAQSLHTLVKNLKGIPYGSADGSAAADALAQIKGQGGLFDTLAPKSGQAPGAASQVLREADTAHGLFKNAEALQGWQGDIKRFPGSDVSPSIKSYAKEWSTPGTAQGDALDALYKAQDQTTMPRWATHVAHEGLAGALGGAVGHATGHDPWMSAAIGAGTYGLAKPLLKGAIHGYENIGRQGAFDAAYPALTGMNAVPRMAQAPAVGDLIRRAAIGTSPDVNSMVIPQ